MATDNTTDIISHDPRKSLLQAMSESLRIAEELQEKCDKNQRTQIGLLFIGICATATLIVIAFYFFALATVGDKLLTFFLATLFIYSLITGSFVLYLGSKYESLVDRDRRALNSIVDMMRELEGALIQNDGFKMLEREAIKIRLSRFGIGPGAGH